MSLVEIWLTSTDVNLNLSLLHRLFVDVNIAACLGDNRMKLGSNGKLHSLRLALRNGHSPQNPQGGLEARVRWRVVVFTYNWTTSSPISTARVHDGDRHLNVIARLRSNCLNLEIGVFELGV